MKGHLYKTNGYWFIQHDVPGVDGERHQKRTRVALVKDVPSKREAEALATEMISAYTSGKVGPLSSLTLGAYVEQMYLPWSVKELKKPTSDTYKTLWHAYLKNACADVPIRDFGAPYGHALLERLYVAYDLSKNSLKHLKFFLSGVFVHAIRNGATTTNPMKFAGIPRKARGKEETFAYTLAEINLMLKVLPEPWNTITAVFAFSGLRRGEVRGLQAPDYDGETLNVQRRVYEQDVDTPKSDTSRGAVPVLPELKRRLDLYLKTLTTKEQMWMFQSPYKPTQPLDLKSGGHVMKRLLEKNGLKWYGWHAFRRGLATNLHALGVPDKTIQVILRHSDVRVTQDAYIKTTSIDPQSLDAMARLQDAVVKGVQ